MTFTESEQERLTFAEWEQLYITVSNGLQAAVARYPASEASLKDDLLDIQLELASEVMPTWLGSTSAESVAD